MPSAYVTMYHPYEAGGTKRESSGQHAAFTTVPKEERLLITLAARSVECEHGAGDLEMRRMAGADCGCGGRVAGERGCV